MPKVIIEIDKETFDHYQKVKHQIQEAEKIEITIEECIKRVLANQPKLLADYHSLADMFVECIKEKEVMEKSLKNESRDSFIYEHSYKQVLKDVKGKAKNAADKRHEPTRKRKEQAIQEYKNSRLSKNEFAAKFAEKYHVAESTMRKNWLQGV